GRGEAVGLRAARAHPHEQVVELEHGRSHPRPPSPNDQVRLRGGPRKPSTHGEPGRPAPSGATVGSARDYTPADRFGVSLAGSPAGLANWSEYPRMNAPRSRRLFSPSPPTPIRCPPTCSSPHRA